MLKKNYPHDDFTVKRILNGVQLVKKNIDPHYATVSEMMGMPINFYFVDGNSVIKRINESTAATCGYLSMRDAEEKSISIVAKKGTEHQVINNDQLVAKSGKNIIVEESFTKNDDVYLPSITFKFPWYDEQYRIIGVFGCSLLDYDDPSSFARSLSLLMSTNLLKKPYSFPSMQGRNLSQKELAILKLLVRGKTAKEIANILHFSVRTIEHRLEHLKVKFQARTKSELIDKVVDYFM